jgi:hypothetical protein
MAEVEEEVEVEVEKYNGRPGKPDDRATSSTSSVDAERTRSGTVTDTRAGQALQVFEAYKKGYRALYRQDPPDKTPQDMNCLCRLIDHYGDPTTLLDLVPFFFETPDKFLDEHGHAIGLFYSGSTISRLIAARARKLGLLGPRASG